MKRGEIIFIVLSIIASMAMASAFSMWLATKGHPNSLWFWRDFMGVVSQI